MRAHGKQPREPWTYGEEAAQIALKYLKLRYRLLPYIYTQAVWSSQTGLPVVRPLVLEYQDDPNTHHIDQQYLFGGSLLVAPVFSRSRRRACTFRREGLTLDERTPAWRGVWIEVEAPLDHFLSGERWNNSSPGPELQLRLPGSRPLTLEIYLSSEDQSVGFAMKRSRQSRLPAMGRGSSEIGGDPNHGMLAINLFWGAGCFGKFQNHLIPLEDTLTANSPLDGRSGNRFSVRSA